MRTATTILEHGSCSIVEKLKLIIDALCLKTWVGYLPIYFTF